MSREERKPDACLRNNQLIPLIYAAMIPDLNKVARDYGYALSVHGSMRRDFDLIAVPWLDWALPPSELVDGIARASEFTDTTVHGPEQKPHGREAWTIAIGGGLRIDLSVMPPKEHDPYDDLRDSGGIANAP